VALPGYLMQGYGSTYTDINVTVGEAAMQSVAVRAAVDLIASLASELPVDVWTGDGAKKRELPAPGYFEDPAGDGHGRPDWCYQAVQSWLLRGNLYGDVLDRWSGGFPTQILLHHPDEVGGWLDTDGTVHWTVNGRPADPATFLHRRVNPVTGRVQGLSPIAAHAATIGLSLTTTQFGLQWFRDGAHPGGLLTNEETELLPEQARTAKERFMAALRGVREPVVLGKGWKYQTVQIAPEESQFLETQGYAAAECARMFGPGVAEVLGYSANGAKSSSLTYTNRVDRNADLLQMALNKWLRRLERLLTEMLPRGQYARINRDALLEMTTLDRYRAHAIALQNGFRVINEVRQDEDEKPVPWGNEPFTITPAPAEPADDDQDEDEAE
jgi:HK97 family phage portal protein